MTSGVALELFASVPSDRSFRIRQRIGMVILLADFISPVLQNLQGCEDREAIFCLTEAAQFVVESRHKTGIMNQYRVFFLSMILSMACMASVGLIRETNCIIFIGAPVSAEVLFPPPITPATRLWIPFRVS